MIYTLTLNPAIDRELTVDEIEYDKVLTATEARIDFGGKGFNVSRLLCALNTPSIAVGFVGGRTGERLQNGLHALGIDSDFVWIEGETRTNISIVTKRHDHYVKVNEKGPLVDLPTQQKLLEKIQVLARIGDWWVLAGSLPPGVPQSFYVEVIQILNEQQVMTILDTTGEALKLGCQEEVFLVKPNSEETRQLTGLPVETPIEIAIAAAEIRKMGAQNVVISMGKTGALLQTAEETWLAHSPMIKEKNPIGAGDSMVGGLVWALQQGLSTKEALAWGIASGAATASLSGTEVGSRPLIEELLTLVRFENLQIPANGNYP